MKILFLSAWYPNRYDPMPGLFVKQHAEAVADTNQVAVVYVHPCNIPKTEIVQQDINKVFTTVVYYPQAKGQFPGIGIVKALRFVKAYMTGYRQTVKVFGKPGLVHANILTRVGVIALLFRVLYSLPYVITEHWSRYLPSRNSYHGWLRKCITPVVVRYSRGIVTVSEAMRSAMKSHGIDHRVFEVIPNPVDTSLFSPGEKEIPEQKKIFSHISCFDNAAKNITGILHAVNSLSQLRNDFEFHIAGDGPDRKAIEELSQILGLTGRFVFFKGLVEGEALVNVYRQSLFTVLFSNYENMPVVVAESFACGVPVIATLVGGLPEIVDKNNGVLVAPGNEHNLVLAMSHMLDHSREYISSRIRQFAIEKFGKDKFAEAYNNFYFYIYRTKP